MPSEQIFFGNDQRSGDHSLAGASPLAVNVLIDGAGAVRRRPGLSTWSGFPTTIPVASQVDGIASFEDEVYWVNAFREIRKVAPTTATATNLSGGGFPSYLDGTGRPVFAETAFRLVIAGNGLIEKVDDGETTAERLGGSPPEATQVAALAARIFANDTASSTTAGHVRASGTGNAGNETWDSLDLVSAEARPDSVVTIRENSNELFVWGSSTLQVFSPDGSTILAPGRALNRGIAAAHSVIRADEEFAWLTDNREIVISDGRGVEVISDPIAKTLDEITTVSDCWGFRLNMDQFDALAWVFPTDGRTFAYQKGGGWSQWHGWNGSGHTLIPVKAHHLFDGAHLAGLATGQIAKFDVSAGTDLGSTIKAEVQTGYINRNTDAVKHCQEVRLTIRRGHSTSAEPQLLVSWRDDLGAYCDPVRVGLGTTGDNVFTARLQSLGTYRARQWRIEFTDSNDFVLARAEETFAVGGY